jgi:uncharacterized RDD family membrane protein YckC
MEPENHTEYAGSLGRFIAFVIDCIFARILALFIAKFITYLFAFVMHIEGTNYSALIGIYVYIIVSILYFSVLESSSLQATFGKMLYGIQTVDINYHRLSYWKALIKSLIMWVVPVFFVGGYVIPAILIMAIPIFFTEKKHALFDMIAGSLVIKKNVMD